MGNNVNWWKCLNIQDGPNRSWDLVCENDIRITRLTVKVNRINNSQVLVFKKAQEGGRKETNTNGFKVGNIDLIPKGSRVTFTWVQDH